MITQKIISFGQNSAYCLFCFFIGKDMKQKKYTFSSPNTAKKAGNFFPFFVVIGVLLLVICVACASVVYFNRLNNSKSAYSSDNLEKLWADSNFEELYKVTGEILETKPIQSNVLIYRGFCCYYLAIAQTDMSQALTYIDEAINLLRIALISVNTEIKGQVEYMLAKSYFQKNTFASYNSYGDLVIKYFEKAKADGYVADDMAEYLGLTYAALGMTEKSISAFTEALSIRESDVLLNAIGEQYYLIGEYSRAKQYLFKVVNDSKDDLLVLKCRNILGKIYLEENNLMDAKKEFEAILAKDSNFADAYYGLGLLYEKQGDMLKARSEWRKTLQVQMNHQGALQKLNND